MSVLSLEGQAWAVAGGVLWAAGLTLLLVRFGVVRGWGYPKAVFVYGLFLVLTVDALYWLARGVIVFQGYDVAFPAAGSLENGVSSLGFLLMLYVGGLLVYDGMLRTENTFSRLHEKRPRVVGPPGGQSFESDEERAAAFRRAATDYSSEFLTNMARNLDDTLEFTLDGTSFPSDRTVSVQKASVFAAWFVVPFFVTGVLLNSEISALSFEAVVANAASIFGTSVLSALAFFEVVVFFQFLVLIKYFHRLLTDHSPDAGDSSDGGFVLRYQPDHPDGYAGFRDLGKLATRVNTLLFLGGVYTTYRIYVAGLAAFPDGGITSPSSELLVWGFNFLAPLVVYLITVVVWTYFSFWQLHKTMRRGRERQIQRHLSGEHDSELPDEKQHLKQAPGWPLDVRTFISIVVGDFVPLLGLLPLVV